MKTIKRNWIMFCYHLSANPVVPWGRKPLCGDENLKPSEKDYNFCGWSCNCGSNWCSKRRKNVYKFLLTTDDDLSPPQTWGLFQPDGHGKLMWDFFCMLLIFYEILIIPFELSFGVTFNAIWDTIINMIFLTDILVTFNSGYYQKGVLVQNRA